LVFGLISTGLRLEVIAKIGLVFFAHFLGCRLFAMFGVGSVVFHAHFADMQLGVTGFAYLEPTQWEAKL
jgi:hypothetical protein